MTKFISNFSYEQLLSYQVFEFKCTFDENWMILFVSNLDQLSSLKTNGKEEEAAVATTQIFSYVWMVGTTYIDGFTLLEKNIIIMLIF